MSLMSLRWSILVAAILLLVKKSLVQVLEAPLARFTHIREIMLFIGNPKRRSKMISIATNPLVKIAFNIAQKEIM